MASRWGAGSIWWRPPPLSLQTLARSLLIFHLLQRGQTRGPSESLGGGGWGGAQVDQDLMAHFLGIADMQASSWPRNACKITINGDWAAAMFRAIQSFIKQPLLGSISHYSNEQHTAGVANLPVLPALPPPLWHTDIRPEHLTGLDHLMSVCVDLSLRCSQLMCIHTLTCCKKSQLCMIFFFFFSKTACFGAPDDAGAPTIQIVHDLLTARHWAPFERLTF